jgi:SnoaL-like domain
VTLSAADRVELTDLVGAYARAVDTRDYAGLAGLFAPGSRVGKFETAPGAAATAGYWRAGGEPFAASVRANHARFAVTTHLLGQHTLSDLSGRAAGELYCLAHHVYAENGRWLNRVMAIRYLDEYIRRPAGWRFAERRLLVDWVEFRAMGSTPDAGGWQPTPG